jgi:hypothetical protein
LRKTEVVALREWDWRNSSEQSRKDFFNQKVRLRLICVNFNHLYRAASRETRRTKTPSSPPSAKYPHKYSAHNTRNTSRRSALMSGRVA